jgi:hypothetical protein
MEFDLEALKKQAEEAQQKKDWLGAAAGVADLLGGVQSLGEIKKGVAPRRSGDAVRSVAASMTDPIERQRKLLSAYREAKSAAQEDKDLLQAQERKDPASELSKRYREMLTAQGLKVPDSLSADQIKEYMPLLTKKLDTMADLQKANIAANAKIPKGMQKQVGPDGQEILVPLAKQLPPDKVLSVNEGNNIPSMLQDIKGTLESQKGTFGPISGRLASMNPWGVAAKSADAQMRAVSQAFGRYMEGGVLRKEDEEKYRLMFPGLSDTPEVAKNKLAIAERLLAQKQNSNVDALKQQGYDVSGVDQRLPVPGVPDVLANKEKGASASWDVPSATAGGISEADKQAYGWAKANPNDPRSAAIIERLKERGLTQ